jgi:GTPase SAR1 family protein
MSNNNIPTKNNNPLNLKFIIIGDAGVGKTSLLHYFIFNKCNNNNI